LDEDDRTYFSKSHGLKCPGAVKVNFFGENKETYALLLKLKEINCRPYGTPKHVLIITLNKNEKNWELIKIDDLKSLDTPVIWSEPKGKYEDVYGKKKIQAKFSAILLAYYESSAILYYWTGKDVDKIWLSD